MKTGTTDVIEAHLMSEREYLLDMLTQMAKIATSCGEVEIAQILNGIVTAEAPMASRSASLGRTAAKH